MNKSLLGIFVKMEKLQIYTDGGSRGNPGPAAIGVVVKNEKEEILTQFAKRIGEATNNVAEYTAVIEALRWLSNNLTIEQLNNLTISFFLDSRLVVNQLNGLSKIKDNKLRELLVKIRGLETEAGGKIFYQVIPREKNCLADKLVNESLEH